MALSPYDPRATLHAELLRLTRGLGGLRLALADGVDRLEALGGVMRLGMPNLDAYARERLGRTGRWLGDARTLARRLTQLPLVREAYLSGRLSTSKAELLARELVRNLRSGECDEDGQRRALESAKSMTVRQLRAHVVGQGASVANVANVAPEGEEVRRPWVQVTRHVDRVDAVAFEGAIRLMNALGASSRSEAIEGLLAEGLTTLLNASNTKCPEWVQAPTVKVAPAGDPEPSHTHTDIGPAIEPAFIDASIETIEGLDQALQSLAAEMARRDLRLGRLAIEAEQVGLARALGHTTVDDYYREALGIAPSSMAARIALARRVPCLYRLEARIHNGAIGFETATLLARVAAPTTEAAWLVLADVLTVKLFREQVDAAELHARVQGLPLHSLSPPTHDQVEDARDLERAVFTMVLTDDPVGVVPVECDDGIDDVPEALGTVPLRLTLPEDIAMFWRDLECLFADAGTASCDLSFVAFLVAATLANWRGVARLPAYGDIYLRDRFRCQNPTCRSRNCTPHHIVFRSHGGGDEPSNLVSLCERCHLDLVHGRHLTVTGQAPDALTWTR